jgi:hypothetical protein
VLARRHVVESVEHQRELRNEVAAELLLLDIVVVCLHARGRVELQDGLPRHRRLGLVHVALAEEELPVQVGHVDGVEVDDVDVGEAGEHKVLEQLAANAAGANHQHLAARHRSVQVRSEHLLQVMFAGPLGHGWSVSCV